MTLICIMHVYPKASLMTLICIMHVYPKDSLMTLKKTARTASARKHKKSWKSFSKFWTPHNHGMTKSMSRSLATHPYPTRYTMPIGFQELASLLVLAPAPAPAPAFAFTLATSLSLALALALTQPLDYSNLTPSSSPSPSPSPSLGSDADSHSSCDPHTP